MTPTGYVAQVLMVQVLKGELCRNAAGKYFFPRKRHERTVARPHRGRRA